MIIYKILFHKVSLNMLKLTKTTKNQDCMTYYAQYGLGSNKYHLFSFLISYLGILDNNASLFGKAALSL